MCSTTEQLKPFGRCLWKFRPGLKSAREAEVIHVNKLNMLIYHPRPHRYFITTAMMLGAEEMGGPLGGR